MTPLNNWIHVTIFCTSKHPYCSLMKDLVTFHVAHYADYPELNMGWS